MKRLVYLFLICLSVVSCDLYQSDNGDLDGMWKLQQIDSLQTNHFKDLSESNLTYSILTDLLQLRDGKTSILCRFKHTADSLVVYHPYCRGSEGQDVPLENVSLLLPYGISDLHQAFHIDILNSGRMVLSTHEIRLHFQKY